MTGITMGADKTEVGQLQKNLKLFFEPSVKKLSSYHRRLVTLQYS